MINCIYAEPVIPNTKRMRALLMSSETPSSLTITGADVEGMQDDDIIAIGSVLRTPEKTYAAFVDGTLTELS